jgi:prevent-host-death family protein
MTKIVTISEAQTHLRGLLATARDNGDEIIIEENGEPVAKLTAFERPAGQKRRVSGLGKGTTKMSSDFDDELPKEFWNFD